ncbi:rab3 GTPase-activating protein non-catalytic subunit-like [Tropilaelaps mercedesae]|uniref:Rab3 GTPase-activating protein non-catalytic subunit-like n=1 Tax=Tropilaelaps mercedesae TaxID=418985 RepID=A0A1V9XEH2_9ACAR|nr:rab3 GTPase-activating protein non-catalytic subunit-like [Tropilaelaps mercedesae]
MAFMSEKAVLHNFDSFFNKDEAVEKYAGHVSFLPSHNLLAIVTSDGDTVVFSGKNTTTQDGVQSFKPKASIVLDNDVATCVHLLPVASKRTSFIGGSWCTVVVGTQTGDVVFHNEEGLPLLRQNLFTQAVSGVCTSINAALEGYLYATSGPVVNMVGYGELVVELEGRFNTLILSPGGRIPPSAALGWKSLRLQQVKNTQAVAVTHHGVVECHFDQLERCTIERYGSRGEVSNASNVLVSSVGSDPFYNLTVSRETTQTNLVTDLAVAVASKFGKMLSDNVPFWSSRTPADAETDHMPKISSLGVFAQHGLFDRDRLGTHLCLSPSKRFIALADGLARIILTDTVTGVPLYVIKGYRRVQLGWITSASLDGSGRQVELLVVYSAKLMQIELWNTRKASRVTAFNAPEGLGMLLYNSGNFAKGPRDDGFASADRQTYFLTKNGRLYDIRISFSEALDFEDINEMQGHLDDLAEVKKILGEYCPGYNLDRFEKLLKRFKRVSLVQQIVKMVCDCPAVDESLVEILIKTLKGKNFRGARKATVRIQGNLSRIARLVDLHQHLKESYTSWQGELRDLPTSSDLHTMNKFKGVFDYDAKDYCFRLSDLCLGELLTNFAVLVDTVETKIGIEQGEEAESFVARLLWAAAENEDFFRLMQEQEICMWSVTSCLLHGLFSSSISVKERMTQTFTALGHILAEVRAQNENVEPFLTEVYEKITETENIPAAMLASFMMRTLLSPEKVSLLEDIEESLECKVFAGLFNQLQSILPLAALLRCRIKDETLPANEYAKTFPISLKGLSKSEGHISDIVSQWICEQRLNHEHLRKALGRPSVVPCFEDTLDTSTISLDAALQLLKDIRITFPVSLQLETLLANCCWSYLCLWNQNIHDAEILSWSMGFLRAIQAYKLKEGLCHMIWKSHLQVRVIAMARIMEQSGILPDAQLEHHVQVGRCALGKFFSFCSTILDIIIESMLPSEDAEILCPLLKEEVLSAGFAEGNPSLISQALNLPQVLRDTVHLHYSLVTILAYCTQFNLDETRPLSLFDSAAQSALSEDLCEVYQRYNQSGPAGAVSAHRMTFLRRTIEGCVQRLPEVYMPEELLECQACVTRLIDLAHSWDIDTDVINKEYVLQLYSGGHDQLAKEIMSQVSDRRAMADSLIIMIGLRVRALLGQIDRDTCEKLGVVSTRLNRWMAELPDKILRCTTNSTASILSLVQSVLLLVAESSLEAQLLNDVVLVLTNLQSVKAVGAEVDK